MQVKMKDIAEVIAGYTFRGAIEPSVDGNTFVLQAKNVKHDRNIVDTADLLRTSFKMPRSNAYLRSADVVIVSRGMGIGSLRSTLFKCSAKNVIASSAVHIIRIRDKNILPEYIALLLNSDAGQNALSGIVIGAHLMTLPRKNLEDFEIPIPSLEKQKLFISLQENIMRQNAIAEQKNMIRKKIINDTLRMLITAK